MTFQAVVAGLLLAPPGPMPSPIRIDIPGVVYEETYRCQQERFLMLPEEEFNDLQLGAIGRGLALFPNVRLHDLVHMSNHGHRTVSSTDGVSRAYFTQYVNQRISFEAKRKYGWTGGIFSRPARPIPCITTEDQLDSFRYLRAHGLKENLVEKADDWPGISALPFLRYGRKLAGTFVWRDDETKAKKRANGPGDLSRFREKYPVTFTKLPALEHLSWDEIHEYTDKVVKELEEHYASIRTRPVLGRAAILAQDPLDSPKSSNHSPAPIARCRDKKLAKNFRRLAKSLTQALRQANQAVRDGAKNVVFPPFCYPARRPYVSWNEAMTLQAQSDATRRAADSRSGNAKTTEETERATSPPSLLELLTDQAPYLLG